MCSKEAMEQECRHFKILHRILGSLDKANPKFILDPSKRTKRQPSNSQIASSVHAEGEALKEVPDDGANDSLESSTDLPSDDKENYPYRWLKHRARFR